MSECEIPVEKLKGILTKSTLLEEDINTFRNILTENPSLASDPIENPNGYLLHLAAKYDVLYARNGIYT
jgi:hypothetical protein